MLRPRRRNVPTNRSVQYPNNLAFASRVIRFIGVSDRWFGCRLSVLPAAILHISATDDAWWPDPEVTGRAIKAAEPENWHADQRLAVDAFFTAVIHASLDPDRHHVIDSWMCAIAKSGFPVQPRLAAIQKHKAAVLSYFTENAETLPQRKLVNAFWELPCEAHDTIVDWFHSESVRTIVATEYGYVFPKGS